MKRTEGRKFKSSLGVRVGDQLIIMVGIPVGVWDAVKTVWMVGNVWEKVRGTY